jgi:hemoglobin
MMLTSAATRRLKTALLTAVLVPALGIRVHAAETAAAGTLYDHLGGRTGVTEIARTLIDRAAADPVLGRSFEDTNLKRIEKLLAEQLCELSGGPCRYSGDPMREVHASLHISQAEFYTMVAMLRDILKQRHVDLASTNRLLRLLAPMKRDIVEAQGAARRPQPEAPP